MRRRVVLAVLPALAVLGVVIWQPLASAVCINSGTIQLMKHVHAHAPGVGWPQWIGRPLVQRGAGWYPAPFCGAGAPGVTAGFYRLLGVSELLAGRETRAEDAFREAVVRNTTGPVERMWLGLVLQRDNRIDEAIDQWLAAGQWWMLQGTYASEGLRMLNEGKGHEAARMFRGLTAVAQARGDPYWISQGFEWLGAAYIQRGKTEEAIRAFEEAVSAAPGSFPALQAAKRLQALGRH